MTTNTTAKAKPKVGGAPKAPAEQQLDAAVQTSAPKGKLGVLVELLSRPEGATIADMADATGWQDHSIRGALAGALKKRGFVATSAKVDGVRVYRLGSEREVEG